MSILFNKNYYKRTVPALKVGTFLLNNTKVFTKMKYLILKQDENI